MLESNVRKLIDAKAMEHNGKNDDFAIYVASRISLLNDYIEQKVELSETQIDEILSELVGHFTTSLHLPLNSGMEFLRARTYNTNYRETDISQLSYIKDSTKASLGRLNSEKQSVYYGCIYFNEDDGINVSFSESNSKVGDTVNILRSTSTKEIKLYYIGLPDHIRRQTKPSFIESKTYNYFVEVDEYQRKTYTETVYLAHLLCDKFLSDILRRKESGNLYKVTSKLFNIFCDTEDIDGIIYTSVKSEGPPVVALKTDTVDNKMEDKSSDCYRITYDYGYSQYRALHTHKGTLKSKNLIEWEYIQYTPL